MSEKVSDYIQPKVVLVKRNLIVNDEDKFLLIRRADNVGRNPGKWEAPGGKVDAGENSIDTAIRETMEETGLVIEQESGPSSVCERLMPDGKYSGSIYLSIFGIARVLGGSINLSEEHDDFTWDSYEESLERNLTNETRNAILTLGKIALKTY